MEKKYTFYFQSKVLYRAEDRPADIRLKMTFNVALARHEAPLVSKIGNYQAEKIWL